MGRLLSAENELNELFKSSKELLSTINFCRLKNAARVVWCVKKMRMNYKKQKERKEKARKLKEQ